SMATTRRSFLVTAGSGAVLAGCATVSADPKSPHADADEVTPVEDLMREHGVLRRVMYLYDETIARIDAKQAFPADAVAACADIVRHVIEAYHEKLEESFLFPR